MLTLGGYLKQKEHLSARLGDVLSSLYMASMVLKHYENQGRPEATCRSSSGPAARCSTRRRSSCTASCATSRTAGSPALMRARDLPARPHVLRRRATGSAGNRRPLIMPTASARAAVATASTARVEPGNPLGLLQEALVLSMTAEPLEKRIRVEGVKTGRVTALDLPGQIEQAQASGSHRSGSRAAARLRPQGHGHHQRRRFRERGTHGRRTGGAQAGWRCATERCLGASG